MTKKCFVYLVRGDYDEADDVRKIFDTREKAETWHKQMLLIEKLHNQYHRDGTVERSGHGTSGCPEIQELKKQAGIKDDFSGNDGYVGEILEMNIE
jgi:hypothetical protein